MNSPSKLPPTQQAIRARCYHPTGSYIKFPPEEIEQSIPERFERQVAKHGNRIAVKSARHQLTYSELDKLANQVAHAVLGRWRDGQQPVALLMEHDAPVIAAILGILKAGKIYVPLDPSLPLARARYILEDSRAICILTNTKNLTLARDFASTGLPVINVDGLDGVFARGPSVKIQPEAHSWIIYTSGSTGRPKGVIQNHHNVLHYVMNYTNGFHVCADDRLTLLYSFSVNGGGHDIFTALLNGSTLFPWDLKEEGFTGLGEFLIREKITIYHSVPTVFRHFLRTLTGSEAFPDLRVVRMGGEPVYKRDVESYKKYFANDCIFVNRLGSSETGSLRWYFIDKSTEIDGTLVPVGFPAPDNETFLIDDTGKKIDANEGEIAVQSRYLSPGYWDSPDLTDAVFLPDPHGGAGRIYRTGDMGRLLSDGNLVHLGRKDFQVKIRGYRVELDEIEMALLDHPAIREAVVMARENGAGDLRLVAYIVGDPPSLPSVGELRNFLRARLPDYMNPSAFVVLDAIPLTATRKIDRMALPLPGRARPDQATPYRAPETPIERELVGIWAEAMDLDRVGVDDDFFESGGHSLAATRVVSRVIKSFQLELPLNALFESPTVAAMAAIIAQHQGKKVGDEVLTCILTELEALSDEEAQRRVSDVNPTIAKK